MGVPFNCNNAGLIQACKNGTVAQLTALQGELSRKKAKSSQVFMNSPSKPQKTPKYDASRRIYCLNSYEIYSA
ncbi:MAG: hypothetical protein ABIO88_10245 [Burkholderiaceae bacterium]